MDVAVETIQIGRVFTYGSAVLTIYGEITEADAHNFAMQMAQDDALDVYKKMVKKYLVVDPALVSMQAVFTGVENNRAEALKSFADAHVPFKTAEAEKIFRTEYTHAFFGYFVTLMYSQHLSQNAR